MALGVQGFPFGWFYESRIRKGGLTVSIIRRYNEQFHQSKLFFEGRIIIKENVMKMLKDQISNYRVVKECGDDIEKMTDQMVARLYPDGFTQKERNNVKREQIKIKKSQIIRLLSDFYVEIILNPTKEEQGGDFARYLREFLRDPSKNTIPIKFTYSGRQSFWRDFYLKFDFNYFDKSELSKILPTLSYTYSGTFREVENVRLNNLELIKNLFNAKIIFSLMKDDIDREFHLLYNYFKEYIMTTDVNIFTIEYLKEGHKGFESGRARLGNEGWGWIDSRYITQGMRDELLSDHQVFKIKDNDGNILEEELKKMVASIIYYKNHYDSVPRVLEGDSLKIPSKCALALSYSEFLDENYFIGTYHVNYPYRELSEKAKELYYSGYPLSFSVLYRVSRVDLISTYLLQEGNQDMMRSIYEAYLMRVAGEGNIEIIQNLGYNSRIIL